MKSPQSTVDWGPIKKALDINHQKKTITIEIR